MGEGVGLPRHWHIFFLRIPKNWCLTNPEKSHWDGGGGGEGRRLWDSDKGLGNEDQVPYHRALLPLPANFNQGPQNWESVVSYPLSHKSSSKKLQMYWHIYTCTSHLHIHGLTALTNFPGILNNVFALAETSRENVAAWIDYNCAGEMWFDPRIQI